MVTDTYEDRLQELADDVDSWMEDYKADTPETVDEDEKACKEGLLEPLNSMVAILREAENAKYPLLDSLVAQADLNFSKTLYGAHGHISSDFADSSDSDSLDDDCDDSDTDGLENAYNYAPYDDGKCLPSFAHDTDNAPLLRDHTREAGIMSHSFVGMMLPHIGTFAKYFCDGDVERVRAALMKDAKAIIPWKETLRPHPSSTPCSRFFDDIPEWTSTTENDHATSVFQARCEVFCHDTHSSPYGMSLSSSGNALAFGVMGGYKNRIPYISYHLANNATDDEPLKHFTFKVDLMSAVREICIDDERRLIFASDFDRVKSYKYKVPNIPKDQPGGRIVRVHTMASKGISGPLAILPSERLAKGGRGKIAIWDLNSLPTHGDNGEDPVGDKYTEAELNTWRDDPEDIEMSKGSKATTVIKLPPISGKRKFHIGKWHRHPSQMSTMICATDAKSNAYHCHALDLEASGKTATRYLGHGDSIDGFSTSMGDQNLFVTSCADGYARLYDVRHPLPVITLATAVKPEPMPAAVLAHPNGVPFIFTGACRSEHIKLWDVRARALVYELATGNNEVESLAWDANHNTLYAATACNHTEYRRARIPRIPSGGDAGEEMDESDDSDDDYKRWPTQASEGENHFGHVFDAGNHRIYKFSFKMNPNPDALPYYGSPSINQNGFW